MKHDLLLGIYTFKIKKRFTSDNEEISINDFLNKAYNSKKNKFLQGFCADVKNVITKVVKNDDQNVGAIVSNEKPNSGKRFYDIMLDGGNTGIDQFIIDEKTGSRTVAGKDKIIGPQFFGRFWLPSSGNDAFVFIQSYNNISIKGIFDTIINEILNKYDLKMIPGRLQKTTSKKRYKEYIKDSKAKSVTIIKNKSSHSINPLNVERVEIELKNIDLPSNMSYRSIVKEIKKSLKGLDIVLSGDDFVYNQTLEDSVDKSKRKTSLNYNKSDINFIPRIKIESSNADPATNYPDFEKMRKFVDKEINILKNEA